jgi:hypothetical protein
VQVKMSYYLHLSSNGSPRYFPANSPHNFKSKLPHKLNLGHGKFQVALSEISYIYSMKTLSEDLGENVLLFGDRSTNETSEIDVPTSHFTTVQHLVESINSAIPQRYRPSRLEFGSVSNRVRLVLSENIQLDLSSKLSEILGFGGQTSFNGCGDGGFLAENCPDLSAGCYFMYIYSDIVSPQIVGSELVPLLRKISLSGVENKVSTIAFHDPHYLPVSRSEVDTISVYLRNEYGADLLLDKGIVSLTLHVRRHNP